MFRLIFHDNERCTFYTDFNVFITLYDSKSHTFTFFLSTIHLVGMNSINCLINKILFFIYCPRVNYQSMQSSLRYIYLICFISLSNGFKKLILYNSYWFIYAWSPHFFFVALLNKWPKKSTPLKLMHKFRVHIFFFNYCSPQIK